MPAHPDGAVFFSDVDTEHERFGVRRIGETIGTSYDAANGFARLLDVPDLHLVRKLVPIGKAAIVSRGLNKPELGYDLEGLGENLVIKRLNMSRIAQAVSQVSCFE
jgi:hypothetical protein